MVTAHVLLLILACVCFGLSAFNVPTNPRINTMGMGLFLWSLTWWV